MNFTQRLPAVLELKAFIYRIISLATDLTLAAPFFLIPLLFSSTGTHTIVIKEIVFQALTWNLALLTPLALWVEQRQRSRLSLPFAFPALLAALALWLAISVNYLSPHPRSEEAFTTWLAYLVFAGLAAILARSPRRFHLCVYSALASSLLVSAYAVLQAFEIDWFYVWGAFTWDNSEVRRVTGSLGNPDYLAGYLAALFPLTLAAALTMRGLLRGAAGALLALQLAALFFTYSRGGLLALVLALAFFAVAGFWLMRRGDRDSIEPWFGRKYLLGAAAASILLILALGLFAREEASAWSERLFAFGRDQAGVTRSHFYRGAFTMWMDKPLYGHGLGMFDVKFPEFRPLELSEIMPFSEFRVEHAHNEFLQIGAELGLVGLAIYLLMFGMASLWAFRLAASGERRVSWLILGLLFAIAATFIHNLFTVTLRYTPSAFLVWGGLGLIVGRLAYLQTSNASWRNRVAATLTVMAALALTPILVHESVRYFSGDWLIQEGKNALREVSGSVTRDENRVQLEKALTLLQRGKSLSPAEVEVYFYLGLAYNQVAFDHVQAREVYEKLEELYPNFTATRMNLGINDIDQAVMLGSPERLNALLRGPRGESLGIQPFERIAMPLVDRIMQQSRRAIEEDPTEPTYYYLMGRAHFARLEFDDAFEAFDEAVQLAAARSEYIHHDFIAECRQYQYKISLLKEGKAQMYEWSG